MTHTVADALRKAVEDEKQLENIILEKASTEAGYAIAYSLLQVAHQLKWLGVGDAATTMGAIEYLGMMVNGVAAAIRTK